MGRKMGNAPVYFTVAQVRFNPVLNLEAYLPAIQGAMRSAGFPDFKRSEYQQFVMPFGAADSGQSPSVLSQARCTFGDIEQTSGFVLESNALAFQTTAYDTYETFSGAFMEGLKIVHDALSLSFFERVGFRFLDAVLPNEGETLADYLVPEVLGLYMKLHGISHSFSETLTISDTVHTISRVIIQNGKVGLTPELAMLAPPISEKFTKYNGFHAVLDTDAFQEKRQPFNLDEIKKVLEAQKLSIKISFETTVKEYALKIWAEDGGVK